MSRSEVISCTLIIILYIPLVFISTIDIPTIESGSIIGKQFYIISYGMIGTFVVVLYSVLQKIIKLYFNTLDYCLIVFGCYMIGNSYFKTGIVMSPEFLMWLCCIIFSLIIKQVLINNIQADKILISILLFSGLQQGVKGILQIFGFETSNHHLGITGGFFNPAPYAGFIASILPLSFALFIDKTNSIKSLRYLALGTTLIILLVLPATWSRASWLAALVSCTLILYSCTSKVYISDIFRRKGIKPLILSLFFVIMTMSLLGLYFLKKDSADGRLLSWKIATNVILDYPIMGVGFGQYASTFGKYQIAYFESGESIEEEAMVAGKGEYVFNEFLRIIIEQGVIGFFLFFGGLFLIFWQLFKKYIQVKNTVLIGSVSSLLAILVFSFFSYPFSMAPNLTLFFILLSLISSMVPGRMFIVNLPYWGKGLIFISSCLLLFYIGNHLNTTYNSYEKWKQASVLLSYHDYEKAISIMEAIYPDFDQNGVFLFQYGQTLKLNGTYKSAIVVLSEATKYTTDPYLYNALGDSYKAMKQYVNAEAAYWKAYYLIPHKFYPLYLLALLYEETGQVEKALKISETILIKKIKVHSPAIDEMKKEMLLMQERFNLIKVPPFISNCKGL